MYIAGTDRCQVYVDEPSALVMALYIRDVCRLTPPLAYHLPPLDPPVTVWPAWSRPAPGWEPPAGLHNYPVDREVAGREWVRWWEHLLDLDSSAVDEFRPPGFRNYRRVPAIRTLLTEHYECATRWIDAVMSDPRVRREETTPRPGLATLLSALDSDPLRSALPFRLRLTVIPVASKHAWPIGREHILISRRLIADTDNALDWLRPRIIALAFSGRWAFSRCSSQPRHRPERRNSAATAS